MVQVHELGFSECPKAYVFRGTKDVTAQQVQDLLGIKSSQPGQQAVQTRAMAAARFLMPVSECSFTLESILEDLQKDPWPVQTDKRPERCTGVAMSIAVGLLESTYPRQGARIMMFIGGPPTLGPGAIVGRNKSEDMRSHVDLQKENAPYFKAAVDHFTAIAKRAVASCHVIDIFASSLDQVGLLEMKVVVEKTGGLVVLADSFGQSVFKESFRRVFRRFPEDAHEVNKNHMQMGFAATLECVCSREVKIQGAIGPCSTLEKKNASVSEQEIGQSGTYAWSMGGVDPSTTIALYFEVANPTGQTIAPNKRRYIQLITQYQHASGGYRARVTTIMGGWHSDPKDIIPLTRSLPRSRCGVDGSIGSA